MKVSFIGLGKLGLPVAVAIDAKGHNVLGYDINPNINSNKTPLQCLHTEEKNENLDGPITSMLINSGVKFELAALMPTLKSPKSSPDNLADILIPSLIIY